MTLTVRRTPGGNVGIFEVRITDTPRAQAAIMASSGQIDCGKRQAVLALADAKGEPLEFDDNEEGRKEADAAVQVLIQVEQAEGRQAERGEVDPNIPCS